jgi:hypothetical protein
MADYRRAEESGKKPERVCEDGGNSELWQARNDDSILQRRPYQRVGMVSVHRSCLVPGARMDLGEPCWKAS